MEEKSHEPIRRNEEEANVNHLTIGIDLGDRWVITIECEWT